MYIILSTRDIIQYKKKLAHSKVRAAYTNTEIFYPIRLL